jgi:T1SS-143 domain-containing protein
VPTLVPSSPETFGVDEGALAFATRGAGPSGDFFGNGNDQGDGATATFSGSISGVVSFGADGPAASGGFHLVDAATASAWLTSLDLTSHNVAVDFAVINGNTLQAWTGEGPGQGHQGAHEVFTLTLNGDGSFTFQLVNPLDDPDPGHSTPGAATEDSVNIDLSGLVRAVDFDGDTISLSSGTPSSSSAFNVTVTDDVPVLVSGVAVTPAVDEGALASGNDPSASFSASGASGSLDTLVSFGADGPAGNDFKFVAPGAALSWLQGLDLA